MGEQNVTEGSAPLDAPAPEIVAPEAVVAAPAETIIETAATAEPAAAEAAPVAPAVEAAAIPEAPVEPAAPEGDKPAAEAAPAEPVLPVYTDFKMPEGFSAAPEQMAAFTGVLGKHGLTQEAGQEFIELHAATVKAAMEQAEQHQRDVFAETQKKWVADFDKQAGNKRDTIANEAKWAISELVPDAEKRKEVWSVLAFTGAGNHPAIVNLMAAAAKRMREPAAPKPALPNNGAKNVNPADRRYGRTQART